MNARRSRGELIARRLVLPLLLALAFLLVVFYVLHTADEVDGPSMEPTLYTGERILVRRGYGFPVRGDVVAFEILKDGTPSRLVKRIVGIPGDTVEVHGNLAIVNGVPEQGGYELILEGHYVPFSPTVVPEGTVFVLGDNRSDSTDSRAFGFVPLANIRGRVVAVYAPITHARVIDAAEQGP